MNERGMKKWAPYKSLDSQADYIRKMHYEKSMIQKPLLMEDDANRINEILSSYNGQDVTVSFYRNGHIYSEIGTISYLSQTYMYLIINSIRIQFRDLVGLIESN